MLVAIQMRGHSVLIVLLIALAFFQGASFVQAQTTYGDLEGPDYLQPPKHYKTLQHILAEAGMGPAPKGPPPVHVTGTREILVILVELNDAVPDPAHTTAHFFDRFFSTTPPSVRDYFDENSYGNFTYIPGDVLGWYSVPFSTTDWDDDRRPIVTAAIQAADADFDFSVYDTDPTDGAVTNEELTIFVLASGTVGGAHHWWTTAPVTVDGVDVEGEYNSTHEFRHIGSYVHELGHDLGLPDLYDTDDTVTGDSEGIGQFGLMGSGSWTFTHMTAWSKIQLGWITPTIVTTPGYYTINDSETNAEAYMLVDNGYSTTEYFLIENKFPANSFYETVGAPVAPDGTLPDEGIMICHVDDTKMVDWINSGTNNVNVDETHKCVDVETAEHPTSHVVNADDLDAEVNRGDSQDLWDNGEYDFHDDSTPCNASWYSGADSGRIVSSIPPSSASMNVVLMGFEPVADAGGPYEGVVGSTMTFDGSASFDQDGTIVSYEWDFDNDGTWDATVAAPTASHKYTAIYNGQVKLRVTDDHGLFSEDMADVIVELPTIAAFSPNSPIYLQRPNGSLFGVKDQDLALVDTDTNELAPNFKGLPFGFSSLDAVDLMQTRNALNTVMVFSVRTNRLLGKSVDKQIYAHKEDIISLDIATGQFQLLMDGLKYGVPNVDAVSILEDDSIVFSTDTGFMIGSMWFDDEDLVHFDPNTQTFSLYFKGAGIGLESLDAVEVLYERIYFSVSQSAIVGFYPFALYVKPGDVAIYNTDTGELEFFMQGLPLAVSTLDAICFEGLVRMSYTEYMRADNAGFRHGSKNVPSNGASF